MKHSIDVLLGRAVSAGEVPGVAAMVTSRDKMLYAGAFGKRMLGGDAPMDLDTVCWLASLTKGLVAVGAMQLVERGVLDLNQPVQRWLPELGQARVLEGFDEEGRPRLRVPKHHITLVHLLTHTAGFGYEIWNAEIMKYQQATGTPGTGSGMNALLGTPLLFEPGARWNYGINLDWTGKLIEAVSGQTLGTYLAKNVFAPLGMDSTGFKITPAMRARLARMHQRHADGTLEAIEREVRQDAEFESGGGGLYSTASDYLKFLRMMLDKGKAGDTQLLKPETVALMARNHMGATRVTRLKAQFAALSNDAEFFPGVPKSWGLSFQINEAPAPTGRPAGGLMWGGLSNCYYWIDPHTGVGGVYFTQILPFCDVKSLPLYYAFETAVYDALKK